MKIKNCPFCGGEAELVPHLYYSVKTEREEVDSFHVECKTCQSQGYAFWGTEKQAIEAWNRRKPLEDIVEQLEELADEANDKWCAYDQADDYYDGREDGFRKAIEIVKGGA